MPFSAIGAAACPGCGAGCGCCHCCCCCTARLVWAACRPAACSPAPPLRIPCPAAGPGCGRLRAAPHVLSPLARHPRSRPLHAGAHWAAGEPAAETAAVGRGQCAAHMHSLAGAQLSCTVGAPRRQRRGHPSPPRRPAQRPAHLPAWWGCRDGPSAGSAGGACRVLLSPTVRIPGWPRPPPGPAHTWPADCGVDGVKVDVQSTVTMFGYASGA